MTVTDGNPEYGAKGACLLHLDFHPMWGDCWSVVEFYYRNHPEVTELESLRQKYLATWETAILKEMMEDGTGTRIEPPPTS